MPSSWPLVELGKLTKYRKEFIAIDDSVTYRRVTAKLQAKGIVLRDEIEGRLLKTKKQQICKGGDFLVAEIDAKVGGFGIIPDELEGAIVSSHYFLFEIDEEQLQREYLGYFVRTRDFQKQILARGSTNYASIRPEKVLDLKLPLPPLFEQKRIVKLMDSLMTKIDNTMRMRTEAIEETCLLPKVAYERAFESLISCQSIQISKIAKEVGQQIQASDIKFANCPYLSLENIEAHSGRILGYRTCGDAGIRGSAVLFGTDDVLYSKLRPYLNKVVTPSFKGCGTTELVVLKPDTTMVERQYLAAFLRSPQVVRGAVANSAGTKMPRTNMKWFREIKVPLPPLDVQREIVAHLDFLQSKASELRELQEETEKEMGGLVPSILNRAFNGELDGCPKVI